jgi:hypothetical protein
LLSTGKLEANVSTDAVATGDDFRVDGTLKGPTEVEILTVAPKGVSGKGLRLSSNIGYTDPFTGITTPYTGCTYL